MVLMKAAHFLSVTMMFTLTYGGNIQSDKDARPPENIVLLVS